MVVALRNFQSALGAPWDESPSPHEGSDWWNQQKIGRRATEGSLLTAEDKCDRNREGEQLITKENRAEWPCQGTSQYPAISLRDDAKVSMRLRRDSLPLQ